MSTMVLSVIGVVLLVVYVLRRQARLRKEESEF